MYLHSMVPLVAFLGLVHFRITLSFLVLSGRCGVDNGCIHNGATSHHKPCLLESFLDVIEDCLTKVMLFQQMPKLQQGGRVRNLLLQEVDSYEAPHGVTIVDRILEAFIRQVEPDLKQVHPEHNLDSAWRTAALPMWIIR